MPSIQALKVTPDKTRGLFAASAAIAELPAPEHMNDLAQICRAALEDAEVKQASTLIFPALPLAKQNSLMFQAINILYKTMRDFQDSHSYPQEILIYCEDDRVLNLYMVVWNMYYAADKPSRMNDGRWD